MTQHIHVHLHRTADAGTSEGARKAAQTRKSGGGAKQAPIFNAMHYNSQAENHYNMAKSHGKQGGRAHNNAAGLHSEAARLNKQATGTGRPEHVAAAKAATSKANAASKRLGHVFHHYA